MAPPGAPWMVRHAERGSWRMILFFLFIFPRITSADARLTPPSSFYADVTSGPAAPGGSPAPILGNPQKFWLINNGLFPDCTILGFPPISNVVPEHLSPLPPGFLVILANNLSRRFLRRLFRRAPLGFVVLWSPLPTDRLEARNAGTVILRRPPLSPPLDAYRFCFDPSRERTNGAATRTRFLLYKIRPTRGVANLDDFPLSFPLLKVP